jgi:hypothetical protein
MIGQRHWPWLLIGSVLIGCSPRPEVPSGTGARECAQNYYQALVHRDWSAAYAVLDTDSRKRWRQAQYSQLAQDYCRELGFEPQAVYVRACEERDTEATAHVVLTGRSGARDQRHKDALLLRRGNDGWRVVVPPNFGRARKR